MEIKGKGKKKGDLGEPQGVWVSSHAGGGTAALGIGNAKWASADRYNTSKNPVRIYRCVKPDNGRRHGQAIK